MDFNEFRVFVSDGLLQAFDHRRLRFNQSLRRGDLHCRHIFDAVFELDDESNNRIETLLITTANCAETDTQNRTSLKN